MEEGDPPAVVPESLMVDPVPTTQDRREVHRRLAELDVDHREPFVGNGREAPYTFAG